MTTVKVRGDTKGLDAVEKATKKAFDPRIPREFQRAAKELNSEVMALTRRQVDLARAMKDATDPKRLKDMKKEFRSVVDEAKALEGVLRSVQRMGSGSNRGPSFGAGLAQGLGVAQYVPTGPGMGSRIAGAAIGGGVRRGLGGMAAPFMQPGVGGMSAMLQAFPFVGQAASGALSAAQGYWQENVAWQRGKLGLLPYVQNSSERAMTAMGVGGEHFAAARKAGTAAQAERAEEKIFKRKQFDASEAQIKRAEKRMDEQIITPQTIRDRPWWQPNTARDFHRSNTAQVLKGTVGAIGAVSNVVSDVFDLEGPAFNKDARIAAFRARGHGGRAESLESAAEKSRRSAFSAQMRAFGKTGAQGPGYGTRYGFMPTETTGLEGQFLGAYGGTYGKAGSESETVRGMLRESLVMKRAYGIGTETSGAYYRGFTPGGGATGKTGMADVVGTARVGMGLQGGRLQDYLQELVSLQRKAEQQGLKINIKDMSSQGTLLSAGLGFEGPQAQRVLGSLTGAAQDVGRRGLQGPSDMLMLQAAGFKGGGGADYSKARLKLMEQGVSGDILENLLGTVVGGISQASGMDPYSKQIAVIERMGDFKTAIGPKQARDLLAGTSGGKISAEAMARFHASRKGVGEETLQGMEGQASFVSRAVGGAAVTSAKMQAQGIGAGSGYGKLMQEMQTSTVAASDALRQFSGALTTVSKTVTAVIGKMGTWAGVVPSGD